MIKIGEDTEFEWWCHLITCSCLKDEDGNYDDNPSLEDCIHCESLELKPRIEREDQQIER